MTTTTPWSDTPPSEPGEWWVKRRLDGSTLRLTLLPDGYWITSPYMVKSGRVAEQFQFGPRVLGAGETVDLLARVERLERENAELRQRYERPLLGITSPMSLHDDPQECRSPVDDCKTYPLDNAMAKAVRDREAELDGLRAQAAELAGIKAAWGMAGAEL